MEIISSDNLNQVRKEIQFLKKNKKTIIVQAQSPEFNRKVLEIKDVDIIINLEFHNRNDSLKQRDSGLNEILAKLAAKNNIKIGIDLNKIKNLDKKQKAIILSRIKQNIALCKRTKTQIIVIDKEKCTKQNILSFFQTLGASTQQAKLALN